MNTQLHFRHVNEIEEYEKYPFVVAVSAWSDCGVTEHWGAQTLEDAKRILDEEIENCKKWAIEEINDPNFEPEITIIYKRPERDEDGFLDTIDCWDEIN